MNIDHHDHDLIESRGGIKKMPLPPIGPTITTEEQEIQSMFRPQDGIEGNDEDWSRVVMSDGRVFTDTDHDGWFDSLVWHDGQTGQWWHWDDHSWEPGWDPVLPPPPDVGFPVPPFLLG